LCLLQEGDRDAFVVGVEDVEFDRFFAVVDAVVPRSTTSMRADGVWEKFANEGFRK